MPALNVAINWLLHAWNSSGFTVLCERPVTLGENTTDPGPDPSLPFLRDALHFSFRGRPIKHREGDAPVGVWLYFLFCLRKIYRRRLKEFMRVSARPAVRSHSVSPELRISRGKFKALPRPFEGEPESHLCLKIKESKGLSMLSRRFARRSA
ncbi:hypothetical protein SKAU_G00393750 [Synaphobranchus kaupii]|uniref:Uncharacterized protein n=1 Tax=Synaphobranchus kaupii TaxID=118154 RepID=A0A9Q1IDV1_SYNKA|nr:hypothetical protein SKAU_G00393750 [Synaphobranchus kaupii]